MISLKRMSRFADDDVFYCYDKASSLLFFTLFEQENMFEEQITYEESYESQENIIIMSKRKPRIPRRKLSYFLSYINHLKTILNIFHLKNIFEHQNMLKNSDLI